MFVKKFTLSLAFSLAVVLFSCGDDGNPVGGGDVTKDGSGVPPSTPTGVTAARNPAGSTTVRISWNSIVNATSYEVYHSNTNSGSGTLEGEPTTTSFNSVGNSTNGTHYFRVVAVNAFGKSPPSQWVSVGPVWDEGDLPPPSAPTGVTAVRNPPPSPTTFLVTTVRVAWSAVSGATSYRIYYSSTGSGTGSLIGTGATPTTTSFTTGEYSMLSTHYFRVTAVNSGGESTPSQWVSVGPQPQANQVRITLTSWRTLSTGGTFDNNNTLDPRIHFIVRARNGNTTVSTNTTAALLDATDIPGNWTGSRVSAWIPFSGTAQTLEIQAVAIEKNPVIDDDYSPNEMWVFQLPVYDGVNGSTTIGTATATQSRIGFSYEFRRQ